MPKNKHPIFSIIIAVFNGVNTLQQCIDSIANQTYQNTEIIIIDGGSTDGTVDLLRFNDQKITYWVSELDNGIYSAWNKGLQNATGDWVCFLGADDYIWNPGVFKDIARSISLLANDINVVYGKAMLLTEGGHKLYSIGKPWCEVKNYFTKYMAIPHPGLMHRRKLFEKIGNFDESFHIAGDYELLLRELKLNNAFFIPIILTGVRQGGVSCNYNQTFSQLMEIKIAQWKNGYYLPSSTWIYGVMRLLLRKIIWAAVGERIAKKWIDFLRRRIGLPNYWTKI